MAVLRDVIHVLRSDLIQGVDFSFYLCHRNIFKNAGPGFAPS